MKQHIIVSATEAARGFGDLLARVRYRKDTFLIRRGRTIVARLEPFDAPGITGADAASAWQRGRRLGAKEAAALATDLRAARKVVAAPLRNPWEP